MEEAQHQAYRQRFADVYIPALRDYYAHNGHLRVPAAYKTGTGVKLGHLARSIRAGYLSIPEPFRPELEAMVAGTLDLAVPLE